ncbi:hypothetical protein KCP77_12050 [Salmonella enterica subsp. enterica]|nr:hypothetical protein KCP77_12050 [Salmonella enterica subsp. enterica]
MASSPLLSVQSTGHANGFLAGKIGRANVERDERRDIQRLQALGWRVPDYRLGVAPCAGERN